MNSLTMLSTTHPEWARMWEWLCDLTGHYTDCNPRSKEYWQYTGTCWKDRPAIGALLPTRVLVHQFRHRDRPETARPIPGVAQSYGRVTLEILASHEYSGNWNRPLEEGSLA